MWILASLLIGLAMILVVRRREAPAPRLDHLEPRLLGRAAIARGRGGAVAACQGRARRSPAPRLRR
jgi:hypothetical protein